MKKKTRLLLLIFCAVCFFSAAPILVAYSMGYRFDFEKMKVVATGGIYVRSFPAAEKITVDSRFSIKPGLFSNNLFVQSLLPDKMHTVFIEKQGYYDYFKNLPVTENHVTKIENVILFKKSLAFSEVASNVDYFSISSDKQYILAPLSGKTLTLSYISLSNQQNQQKISVGEPGIILEINWKDNSNIALIKTQKAGEISYYLFDASEKIPTVAKLPYLDKNSKEITFNPKNNSEIFYWENNTIYSLNQNKVKNLAKNALSYSVLENSILWLSADGALYESDFSGKNILKISQKLMTVNLEKKYRLSFISGKIFLQDGESVFVFNQDTKTFGLYDSVGGNSKIIISPDNKNILLYDKNSIYLRPFSETKSEIKTEKLFSKQNIANCQWLNNDYIIFNSENGITISEIDFRGNLNTVKLQDTIIFSAEKSIIVENPLISFDQHSGKVYILSGETLAESEKLVP